MTIYRFGLRLMNAWKDDEATSPMETLSTSSPSDHQNSHHSARTKSNFFCFSLLLKIQQQRMKNIKFHFFYYLMTKISSRIHRDKDFLPWFVISVSVSVVMMDSHRHFSIDVCCRNVKNWCSLRLNKMFPLVEILKLGQNVLSNQDDYQSN